MLRIESVSKKFPAGNYGVRDFTLHVHGGVLGLLGPNGAGKTTLMQMIATITRPTSGSIFFQDVDILRRPEYVKHTVASRVVGGFSGGMKQRLGIAQALINDPELLIVDEPTAGLDPEERVRFRNLLSHIGAGKLVILSTHIVSDVESAATEIALIKNAALLALASPEALLQSARGSVWEGVVSSSSFEQLQASRKISSAIRKPDGVHVRVVSPEPPFEAEPAEPNLEDAFLFYMNFYKTSPATTA
ncbi:MAG TPA: ATP-binding cassette domain-containing protein [Acidobacteriota bacterium]